METEVSCLRRRLAEEDRGRGKKKNLSAVCVCVLSDPSGVRGGGRTRGLWLGCVCVSGGGVTPGYYLKKRQQ